MPIVSSIVPRSVLVSIANFGSQISPSRTFRAATIPFSVCEVIVALEGRQPVRHDDRHRQLVADVGQLSGAPAGPASG